MLVKNLKIENFKRFETLDIDLKPFDCLVGINNSGKTTLLQALALFDFCLHNCLSGKNGVTEIKRRNFAQDEFYVLPVAKPTDLWTDRRMQAGRKHKIIRITITFNQGESVTAAVDLNYNLFNLSLDCKDTSQEWLHELKQVRMSYLPVYSMFMPREERRMPANVEDALARGQVNSVIRNLLLNLKIEARQNELVEILQRAFPALTKMAIEYDEENDRYISVTYQEKASRKDFDVFSAGSGFQQFLYLFGFILLRQPTVVLLDEPDVHLHGTLQHALWGEMKRLVESGKQVLFGTHSRELINRMNPENIVALGDDGPKRLSVAFDVYDTLDRLGAVDPTQLPVMRAYQRVLVVENEADLDILTAFCSTVLGTRLWHQVERRLAVCYAKGNPRRQDMGRLREQLQQTVALSGHVLQMFVIGDRDHHPDLNVLRQELKNRSLHMTWHVWERTEIENYLLCESAVLRLVEEKRSERLAAAESDFRAEFWKLIESCRDWANDRLVKAFQEHLGKNQDVSTLSQKAREYLRQHWETDKISLVDAKESVLPGLKRWLQNQRLGQFPNIALARELRPAELPEEIHELARKLTKFAGV